MSEPEVIDADTGELLPAVIRTATLFGTENPDEVLEHAREHARVLMRVVKEQKLAVTIGSAEHLRVEAWTLLGSQVGVFPVAETVEPVEIDGVAGFKASVRAVTRYGDVVGRSVAYCMRDEPMWSLTPTNKYGKALEVRNLHALAAMAETRATSRALRKPLGFIVQLAGYNPTAAEEMPEATKNSPKPSTKKISEAQVKRLWVIAREHNVPEDRIRAIVQQTGGVESTKDIPASRYDLVIEMLERQDGPPFA
jgi:hypothetical protein